MHLGDWLGKRAALCPAKVALVDATGGRGVGERVAITYREWDAAANRTARLLGALGIEQGERVAVLSANSVAYLDLWFACGKRGAVLLTLNTRLTPAELGELLRAGEPRVLTYGAEFVEVARALRAAGHLEGVRGLALEDQERAEPGDAVLAEREAYPGTACEPVPLGWDDPWVLCPTGGSTGRPKLAVLTHASITWNAVNTVASWGLVPDDVAILNAPLFHTGGLNVFTAPLVLAGGTSIVCRGFDPEQVFDLIAEGGATVGFGVPTMFLALQRHARWEQSDWSRMRLVLSGGAPCPPGVFARFWERGVAFRTGYGLTEAGPNTFWLPPEDAQRKPGAVGFPLWQVEVRIVDDAGRDCAPDEVGELWIRGPHVCAGYWRDPEETARVFRDGWLRTGDLARRDAQGYHSIVGRRKDVIISGGENIYPAEVEAVLAEHPAVAEVAVIGVPDATWGEAPRAVVVVRAGERLELEDLWAFVEGRLARFKRPRSLVVVAALPRTGAGKVDRARLRGEHGA